MTLPNGKIFCACGCGTILDPYDMYGRTRKFVHGHHTRNKGLRTFWSRIIKTSNGCWLWTGSKVSIGYGDLRINGKHYLAHRLAYELTYGTIPDGAYILHKCDIPACINPEHLFVGNQLDNVHDAIDKGIVNGIAVSNSDVRKIRYLRADGLTLSKIADIVGCSRSHVSRIANHTRRENVSDI